MDEMNGAGHWILRSGLFAFGLLGFFVLVEVFDVVKAFIYNRWISDLREGITEVEAISRKARLFHIRKTNSKLHDIFCTPIRLRKPSAYGTQITSGLPSDDRSEDS